MGTQQTQAHFFLTVVEAEGHGGVWGQCWGEGVGTPGMADYHACTSLQSQAK